MRDYIPRRDSELVAWSSNFTSVVSSNATSWDIAPEELSNLQNASSAFASLVATAESPARTPVIIAEKDAARKELVKEIRGLVSFRLKNPVITDAQRVSMGLHVRDSAYSAIHVPTTRPELDIDVFDVRRLKVKFREMGSDSKAKPYGINGALIVYAVLDVPPVRIEELTSGVLATRTPHVIQFDEDKRGKTVYVAICWQNRKGENGPWSDIEKAIVP
jgi:hypothetical protein